jgi:hypothetical protein
MTSCQGAPRVDRKVTLLKPISTYLGTALCIKPSTKFKMSGHSCKTLVSEVCLPLDSYQGTFPESVSGASLNSLWEEVLSRFRTPFFTLRLHQVYEIHLEPLSYKPEQTTVGHLWFYRTLFTKETYAHLKPVYLWSVQATCLISDIDLVLSSAAAATNNSSICWGSTH